MDTITSIVPHARVYLSTTDGNGVFGSGKGDLLASIERLGSLRQAAIEAGRSYRQVWGDINKAEKYLGFKLVHRSRGGSGGGKMELTEQGTRFLRAWEQHCLDISQAIAASYTKNLSTVINNAVPTSSVFQENH